MPIVNTGIVDSDNMKGLQLPLMGILALFVMIFAHPGIEIFKYRVFYKGSGLFSCWRKRI